MAQRCSYLALSAIGAGLFRSLYYGPAHQFLPETIEEDVDNRSGVEREDLAEKQPADHGDAKRPPDFRSDTVTESKRNAAEKRGHRGHHDGAEAQQAGLVNCLGG